MKKFITLLLAAVLAFALFACGTNDNGGRTGNASRGEVSIVLGPAFFEDEDGNEIDDFDWANEEGVTIVVNDDGSRTITMPSALHAEIMVEISEGTSELMQVSVDEAESFLSVSYNNDFTEITVVADQAQFENELFGWI